MKLKNLLTLLIILSAFSYQFLNADETSDIIKQKISILPIYNLSENPRYDDLIKKINTSLSGTLNKSDAFILEDIENETPLLAEKGINYKGLLLDEQILQISSLIPAEIIVNGVLLVENETVKLYMKAYQKTDNRKIGFEAVMNVEQDIDQAIIDFSFKLTELIKRRIVKKEQVVGLEPEVKEKNNISFDLKKPEEKKILKPTKENIAGYVLAGTGGVTVLSGFTLLIYDMLISYPLLKTAETGMQNGTINYEKYENQYNGYLGLFISSIATIGLGAIIMATSIPFMVYKKDQLAGTILLTSGLVNLLSGLTMLTFDSLGYFNVLKEYNANYVNNTISYDDYMKIYNTYFVYLGLGIGLASSGLAMVIAAIPLLSYEKKTKVSLLFNCNKGISASLSFKF